MARRKRTTALVPVSPADYGSLLTGIATLLEDARRAAARTINRLLTATYWEVGRRIVEYEQGGKARAEYGEGLLKHLAEDLTARHGRGFSRQNLQQMRAFYAGWEICQTVSGKLEAQAKGAAPGAGQLEEEIWQTLSAKSSFDGSFVDLANAFPLPWSHYVRLLGVKNFHGRHFYEIEAVRGGWSIRQLERQIDSLFFERTALSRNKAAMLTQGQEPKPEDAVSAREELRDPYLLEFLDLKDHYSETELEEALIAHLEWFLLELGAGFTFVARQKRLRVGDEWYRIDLLLFHRVLRCLVIVDLKTGKFTHADAGQMNLYLNYAREHLVMPGEADPVELILCSDKNDAVVKYATGGINTRVFASQYLTQLPDVAVLVAELERTRKLLERRPRRGSPRASKRPRA